MIEFLLLILRFATYVRSYGGNVFQTLFFGGGYKVYCIKNVLFYAVQSNYCIKNLFPYHSKIRKHILISFIVCWGIFLLRPIIGSTDSHNLYWNRDIIKYPSS